MLKIPRNNCFLILSILLSSVALGKDTVQSKSLEGISLGLAQSRSQIIRNLHYHLYFEITTGASEVDAREDLEFELTEDVPDLIIDFKDGTLSEVQINSKITRNFVIEEDHIRLPRTACGKKSPSVSFSSESQKPRRWATQVFGFSRSVRIPLHVDCSCRSTFSISLFRST